MGDRTNITINGEEIPVVADDFTCIKELGHGAYGIVEKMIHKPSETVMAVKVSIGHGTSLCLLVCFPNFVYFLIF